jgi:MYXO-CTERM domain-containing protein
LGDRFSNNGGSNFIATFEVVPEPSKALFGMMGLFGLFLRRRRA